MSTFTTELTFGNHQVGILTPDSPGAAYRTIQIGDADPSAGFAFYFDPETPLLRDSTGLKDSWDLMAGATDTRSGIKGELKALGSTDTYGPELVLDKTLTGAHMFWVTDAGVVIGGGKATFTATTGGLYRQIMLRPSATYEVTYTIDSITPGANGFGFAGGTARFAAGTYTEQFVATVDYLGFNSLGGSAGSAVIDNISCRQVITNSSIIWIPANQPANIKDVGYWARPAVTNYQWNSQAFGAANWTIIGTSSITSNTTVAPDGTTTADTFTAGTNPAVIYDGSTSSVGAGDYTVSAFVKMGTCRWVTLSLTASSDRFVWFDLQTGAIGTVTAGATPYIIDCGNGWYRLVVIVTKTDASVMYPQVRMSDTDNAQVTTAGATVHLWQLQVLNGNFPDGGPIIPTAGATQALGLDDFRTTANPYTADQDFAVWITLDFSAATGTDAVLFHLGGDWYVYRSTTDEIVIGYSSGGQVGSGVTATTERVCALMRRRAGKNTLAVKKAGGAATVGADTARAWPAMTTGLVIGCHGSSILSAGALIENLKAKTGTFSDAEIQALLDAEIA